MVLPTETAFLVKGFNGAAAATSQLRVAVITILSSIHYTRLNPNFFQDPF